MAESVPGRPPFVDPFQPDPPLWRATLRPDGSTELVMVSPHTTRLYPPVARLRQLVADPRPPYCTCPRMVQYDGWILVWHVAGCTEVLSEALEAIL